MNYEVTSSFTPPPIDYCRQCGVADSRTTHICPPLRVSTPTSGMDAYEQHGVTLSVQVFLEGLFAARVGGGKTDALTNDGELDDIETWCTAVLASSKRAPAHVPMWVEIVTDFEGGLPAGSIHAQFLALVGELRAERTRTETLRAALGEIAAGDIGYEPTGMDAESEFGDRVRVEGRWAKTARCALAASVEEPQ